MNNIKQFVFNSVLEDIINGVYPLDFVFNEKYLIEKYNVSRSPVRDALIELCNEKILRAIPRYGYEIIRITEKDMRDITQFRLFLEIEAFKLTCQSYCDEMVERIVAYNDTALSFVKKEEPNLRTLWKSNIDFHTMLISFTGNTYAETALEKALSTQYRAYTQLYWQKNQMTKKDNTFENAINEYHILLADLLKNHNFEEAVRILKNDICDITIYFHDK